MKLPRWIQISFVINVNPSITPKKQPPWRSSKEHSDSTKEDLVKLKCARVIKEVFT